MGIFDLFLKNPRLVILIERGTMSGMYRYTFSVKQNRKYISAKYYLLSRSGIENRLSKINSILHNKKEALLNIKNEDDVFKDLSKLKLSRYPDTMIKLRIIDDKKRNRFLHVPIVIITSLMILSYVIWFSYTIGNGNF